MLNERILLILSLFGLSAALTTWGLWRAFAERPVGDVAVGAEVEGTFKGLRQGQWVALLSILLAGTFLRLEGLERRGMTHNEVYVPGIALPRGISEPPPRIGIRETVSWHFHGEPHPQGYYFFMWGWTKAFGTSLLSIRLPSVLFGLTAVILVFLLGAQLFGTGTGLVSAALLALNGHQIFWSQWARNYMPSSLLAIASTGLLVSLLRSQRPTARREIAYVGLTWLALFTQLLSWGLLLGQILAVLRYARSSATRLPRVLQLQGLVAILGMPLLAHAVYQSRPLDFLDASVIRLFQDYLNFGFLFEPDDFSEPARTVPLLLAGALTMVVIVCLALAGRARPGERTMEGGPTAGAMTPVAFVGAGMALFTAGLALLAWRRQLVLGLMALLPLGVVVVLWGAARLMPAFARLRQALDRRQRISDSLGLTFILAFVPIVLMAALHSMKPVLTSRGAIVFTPFVLVAIASGIASRRLRRELAWPAGLALLAVHAASVQYYRTIPAPNDYRSIGAQVGREYRSGDLVFVPAGNWVTTPLFYHLPVSPERLVTADFEKALATSPGARVWMPLFSDQQPTEEMKRALTGFRVERELTAFRGRAQLYVR